MALGIGNLISTAAIDVVGIYTQDFTQVFSQARSIKASIKPESKSMEHPAEIGILTTDHRILLPIEIEMAMFIPASAYNSAYRQIKELYTEGVLLIVHTKIDIHENQMIVGIPREESPNMYDAITLNLKLKEVLFVTPEFAVVPRDPSKKSTTDRGQQNSSTTNKKSSIIHDGFGGLFS